jgi:hypothetical protein
MNRIAEIEIGKGESLDHETVRLNSGRDEGDWSSAVSQIGHYRRANEPVGIDLQLATRSAINVVTPQFSSETRGRFSRKIPVRRFHFRAFRVPLD